MLELYHSVNSVCAQKVRIALAEKGLAIPADGLAGFHHLDAGFALQVLVESNALDRLASLTASVGLDPYADTVLNFWHRADRVAAVDIILTGLILGPRERRESVLKIALACVRGRSRAALDRLISRHEGEFHLLTGGQYKDRIH